MTMSMSGLAMTARASATTCTPSPTTDLARATSRSATMVISMPRPARRLISSWLRRNTWKVPLPTVPMPSRPTWMGFIRFVSLSKRAQAQSPGHALGVLGPISFEETRDAGNGLAQVFFVRQEHDSEMVRRGPIETRALDQHDLGLLEQFEEKLTVVLDRVDLGIEF